MADLRLNFYITIKDTFREGMPYAYEYKKIKDKCGFIKIYKKEKENERKHKEDCKCTLCRLNKYFRLESLEFYRTLSNGKLFEVTIYDSSLSFKNTWLRYWRDTLTDIYKYFSKMPEEKHEIFCNEYIVMTFNVGVFERNDMASNEDQIKLMRMYEGWHYIEFDNSFRDAYEHKEFKRYLERRHIFNAYWTHDSDHLLMFFKKITGKKLELAMKRYKYLMKMKKELNEFLANKTKAYFRGRQWEKLPG